MKLNLTALIFFFLGLITISLITLQFIPFELISTKINSLVADGNAETFNLQFYSQAQRNGLFIIPILLGTLVFLALKKDLANTYLSGLGQYSQKKAKSNFLVFKNNEFGTNVNLILIIIIGGILRYVLLNEPITYDEAFTVNQYTSSSWMNIISNYNYPNNHVFHNLLSRPVYLQFGAMDWSVRSVSFLSGILCLPSAFILGMRLFKNHTKALFLVSLLAFSPILIEYSSMARGYSLVWLLTIWSFIAIHQYIQEGEKKSLTQFILFSALSIWTVPVAIIPYFALLLFLFTKKGAWTAAKTAFWSIYTTSLFYLPILLIYGLSISSHVNLGEEQSYYRLFNYQITHGAFDFYQNFIMIKPIFFGFTAILFFASLITKSESRQWIFYVFLAVVIVVLTQKTVPPARVWTVTLLFFYIPFADKLGDLFTVPKSNLKYYAVFILLSIQLVFFKSKTYIMTDFRYEGAETVVSRISEPIHLICEFPMEAPIAYYWKSYLREDSFLNSKGKNLMIVVSLKHNQTIDSICSKNQLNTNDFHCTHTTEDVQVFELIDKDTVKFH